LKKGTLCNLTNGGETTHGFVHTEESKLKMSKSRKGIPTSELQKEMVGKLFKGKFGVDHNRSKAVTCVETGEIYGSMSEASRELKITVSSVSWSVKHKKPIFGLHFQIKN
jgi:hypothetical protein